MMPKPFPGVSSLSNVLENRIGARLSASRIALDEARLHRGDILSYSPSLGDFSFGGDLLESATRKRDRARRIARTLAEWYPDDTRTALAFRDPFQLLIATILAAQCTDERVNRVAPLLFSRFPDARSLAGADPSEVEALVRPTGFFRAKTQKILACCRCLVEVHAGAVPISMEHLTALPGVGRKTANVIRTNCYGFPGIVVDTHVLRLAGRLGLSDRRDPDDVEADLMALLPESSWSDFSHRLTWLGRRVCAARKPRCDDCRLRPDCPSGMSTEALSPSPDACRGRGRRGGRTPP